MFVPSIKHKPANKPEKPLQQKHEQVFLLLQFFSIAPGLKVNNQLVANATRFLAVCLKKYVWSHHHVLKAKP